MADNSEGDITASLIATWRETPSSPSDILVTTDKPFELKVIAHATKVFQVPASTFIE